jgi:hypothetical protein
VPNVFEESSNSQKICACPALPVSNNDVRFALTALWMENELHPSFLYSWTTPSLHPWSHYPSSSKPYDCYRGGIPCFLVNFVQPSLQSNYPRHCPLRNYLHRQKAIMSISISIFSYFYLYSLGQNPTHSRRKRGMEVPSPPCHF